MAIGDFIVGTLVASPTILIFQPAATVTLLVTGVAALATTVDFSNGVLINGRITNQANNAVGQDGFGNTKIFINNTTFLRLQDNGFTRGFCGVQVA